MIDIVFPEGNEEEFIRMAEKLGIDKVIFAYKTKPEFGKSNRQKALMVEPKHVQNAKAQGIITICPGSREAIERGADIAYNFEQEKKRDATHYRESGLNQVLCRIATEKNVKIGLSFSSIIAEKGHKRAILIGRMMQNIRICQKYKTPMKIASFAKTPYEMRAQAELIAFFSQLGMKNPRLWIDRE